MSKVVDLASKRVDEMSDKEVEEAYDKMLNTRDPLMDNTITKDQAKEVMKAVNSEDTEDVEVMQQLLSDNKENINDGDGEAPEGEVDNEVLNTTVNPNTGLFNSEASEEEKKIDAEMAKLLDIDLEDLYKVPDSINDIPFDEDMVKNNLASYGIEESNSEAVFGLIDTIKEYRSIKDNKEREKINWYDHLPEAIQKIIDTNCAMVGNKSRAAKKLFAYEIIEGIIRDSAIDRMTIDLQESVNEAFDMSGLVSMTMDLQKTNFETNIDKYIETLQSKYSDDESKKEKLEQSIATLKAVKEAFIESYQLTGLLDKLEHHKIRIKKIDLDKYKRHCENFLWKYKKDTPFIISDISLCLPILDRKFKDKYTTDQIARFMIAFMKYTMNMKANDVVDHTFMSYFINNIRNMDFAQINQEENAFINVFLSNIEKGIRLINKLDEEE